MINICSLDRHPITKMIAHHSTSSRYGTDDICCIDCNRVVPFHEIKTFRIAYVIFDQHLCESCLTNLVSRLPMVIKKYVIVF